jgi:AraC-like DNA-binding protein
MLKNTTDPIAKIAEEIGFYDPCHFSRVFRKAVGVSPLSFRKTK